jgi:hypothetical protein
MTDKLSDREIERRKQQAAQNATSPKPHEAFLAQTKGKQGHKQMMSKGRDFRHQGR